MIEREIAQRLKSIPCKNYAHFDPKISIRKAWNYITNPEKISRHHFYPFINFEKDYTKYNKHKGLQPKQRKLCYSAHIDRCIYQYYAYLLNIEYNKLAVKYGISDASVAYRNNLGKNNINFAKQAIDFIRKQRDCYILVGDFTDFFGSLNHKYLKKQLCTLLSCTNLPDDYYAVFKNITKYSEWDLKTLLSINGLEDTLIGRNTLNTQKRVLSVQKFREYKHKYLHTNSGTIGIPQGSAISAVLANIYMLEFDKHLNNYVQSHSGLYMRYSDDFIIVLPSESNEVFGLHYEYICNCINDIPNLVLEPHKTQVFKYSNNTIKNCNTYFISESENGKDFLNYLGFTFDGKVVSVRGKTISKYYYRMYKKLKTILKNKGLSPKQNKISYKNLYMKYSIRGAYSKNSRGNFLTYICRAKKIFGENENIECSTKRHMQKIGKKLSSLKNNVSLNVEKPNLNDLTH